MSKNIEDNFLLHNSYTTQMCEYLLLLCSFTLFVLYNSTKGFFGFFQKQGWKILLALLKGVRISICLNAYTLTHLFCSCFSTKFSSVHLCMCTCIYVHTCWFILISLNTKIPLQFNFYVQQVTKNYNNFHLNLFFMFLKKLIFLRLKILESCLFFLC